MSESVRRATSVAAIFVVVLACVFALMYWWGRSQLNNAATVMRLLPSRLEDYNEVHPHKGLKMQSPREFRRGRNS